MVDVRDIQELETIARTSQFDDTKDQVFPSKASFQRLTGTNGEYLCASWIPLEETQSAKPGIHCSRYS